jgi:hypothetical protein
MENSITYTDMDNSCNVYKTIDPSKCYIREPFDLSSTFFKEHFEGKEMLLGQCIREYFYFTGSPGPPGPSGSADTFLNIYNTTHQQVLKNAAINFESNNYIEGSCAHGPGTSQIHLWKPGFYYVYTNIYHIEGCLFSLCKNMNAIIPGSTIGSLTGSSQNSSVVILRVTDEDICMACPLSPSGRACILEVYNNTPYIPFVTLYDSSGLGYSIPQINATLTIYLLK